jgi:virginiamycin B lyase
VSGAEGRSYGPPPSESGANAIVRFDPATETFDSIELASPAAAVRQLLGRPGYVGAESPVEKLVVITGD